MASASYTEQVAALYRAEGLSLRLPKPARRADLERVQRRLGAPLDAALRAAWIVADGSAGAVLFARPGYLTGYDFVSITEALELQAAMERRAAGYPDDGSAGRDSRIQPGWHRKQWLPFASFNHGDLMLLSDHAPATGGQTGQVIAFSHDPDAIEFVAESFEQLLHGSIATMRAETVDVLALF